MEQKKLNPYTQAMLNCLSQFDEKEENPELDSSTSQFLTNMIQGRFLQYLVSRMCQHYRIQDKDLEKQLSLVLMTILSDKFFVVFREKVRERPEIVFKIAKKITDSEKIHPDKTQKMDALFHFICKTYFEYQRIGIILKWINTNPEVEKIIFLSQIQQRIRDSALIKALCYILQNDKSGVAPQLFNRYLKKNRIERLNSLIKTGDWQLEAEFLQQESSKLITWRNYMNAIE
ncbi:MAG: hypothetical protein OEY59_04760 [Deltaproteobacteria bacterium]|nr:hypothetical protein [Deltaproteobacteria bacterium]